jgi:leader peptidase (prepilin peptidase)/N-methyltransferase
MVIILFLFMIGLCWGSFLNVVAYRLMQYKSFSLLGRSCCTTCHHTLAWYDLIPLASWIMINGTCRYCHATISWLYPFIELLSGCALVLLTFSLEPSYIIGYCIFFSALIITIRTDSEHMLISQFTSIYLAPLGILLSLFHLLPINPTMSICGALMGYLGLYAVAKMFAAYAGKEGLGQGDIELMACIGAFTGPWGCWTSLFIGSIAGSAFGIIFMLITKKTASVKIPFGPFLALGAMIHVLFYTSIC